MPVGRLTFVIFVLVPRRLAHVFLLLPSQFFAPTQDTAFSSVQFSFTRTLRLLVFYFPLTLHLSLRPALSVVTAERSHSPIHTWIRRRAKHRDDPIGFSLPYGRSYS